jgi:hypothetical protein
VIFHLSTSSCLVYKRLQFVWANWLGGSILNCVFLPLRKLVQMHVISIKFKMHAVCLCFRGPKMSRRGPIQ